MNYFVILFKNNKKKKILKSFITENKAIEFYNKDVGIRTFYISKNAKRFYDMDVYRIEYVAARNVEVGVTEVISCYLEGLASTKMFNWKYHKSNIYNMLISKLLNKEYSYVDKYFGFFVALDSLGHGKFFIVSASD